MYPILSRNHKEQTEPFCLLKKSSSLSSPPFLFQQIQRCQYHHLLPQKKNNVTKNEAKRKNYPINKSQGSIVYGWQDYTEAKETPCPACVHRKLPIFSAQPWPKCYFDKQNKVLGYGFACRKWNLGISSIKHQPHNDWKNDMKAKCRHWKRE